MSIVFIAGILFLLIFGVDTYRVVKKHEKYDRVIFAFNQVRRDLQGGVLFPHELAVLRAVTEPSASDSPDILSPQEHSAARLLSEMLDGISAHYARHGAATLFNLRVARRMIESDLSHYRKVRREVESQLSQIPADSKIRDLYVAFERAAGNAFFAHTPFVRAEFLLRWLWRDAAEQIANMRQESETVGGGKFAGV